MSEYIEREALKEMILSNNKPLETAICSVIDSVPAADVAPVVRCRDCEQYVAGEIGYGKCNFFKTARFSEFYCRYGGKKGRAE